MTNSNHTVEETVARLREAAQNVIDRKTSTFRARNGRQVGIEGEDGEKCWIVHSDEITHLECALAALSSHSTPAGEDVEREWDGPLTDAEQAMIDGAWEKHKAAAPCTIPPAGWFCTRAPGHGGPCAAHPLPPSTHNELVEALRVGEHFLDKCFSAWSCGEPAHRVEDMLNHADKFRAALTKMGEKL